LDVEHIMRLGGWESLDMVVRYTRSVRFEESLTLYGGWRGKCCLPHHRLLKSSW
jgi:hypothetical protein